MVDAFDLKLNFRKEVWVRVPPRAPHVTKPRALPARVCAAAPPMPLPFSTRSWRSGRPPGRDQIIYSESTASPAEPDDMRWFACDVANGGVMPINYTMDTANTAAETLAPCRWLRRLLRRPTFLRQPSHATRVSRTPRHARRVYGGGAAATWETCHPYQARPHYVVAGTALSG
jgi:hypothetical protein